MGRVAGDRVELKGIDGKKASTINFNTSIKILLGENYAKLLKMTGEHFIIELY